MKEGINYWKFGGATLVAGLLGGAVMGLAFNPADVDNEALQLKVEEAVKAEFAGLELDENSNLKLDELYEKYFEEDAWEAESEVLALEELEHRDYRELGKFLFANNSEFDEDDIDRVLVKDVEITRSEADDKDATVVVDLKVYFENNLGVDLSSKRYVTATVSIEDGEVEDIDFE